MTGVQTCALPIYFAISHCTPGQVPTQKEITIPRCNFLKIYSFPAIYYTKFYYSKECWKVPTFSCRSHKGIKCHEYLDSHLVHLLSMICSLYFASHNLFWWRLKKKKKKKLILFLLIKWYFRKATYILSIFIRFQIKTNIEIVIFLTIKIAWHHILNKKIYIYWLTSHF